MKPGTFALLILRYTLYESLRDGRTNITTIIDYTCVKDILEGPNTCTAVQVRDKRSLDDA
jgi:hypothetical protein